VVSAVQIEDYAPTTPGSSMDVHDVWIAVNILFTGMLTCRMQVCMHFSPAPERFDRVQPPSGHWAASVTPPRTCSLTLNLLSLPDHNPGRGGGGDTGSN
jgi:hypothetical protein